MLMKFTGPRLKTLVKSLDGEYLVVEWFIYLLFNYIYVHNEIFI